MTIITETKDFSKDIEAILQRIIAVTCKQQEIKRIFIAHYLFHTIQDFLSMAFYRRFFLSCLLLLSLQAVSWAKPRPVYVRISTPYGHCIVRLYDETPQHRDNFKKLVSEGFYDSTLFHRVIKDFMIQGGDPDSRKAAPGQRLGEGDVGYRIPAEFSPALFHKKGVLAAARDNNPEKASSGCQFYLTQGKVYTDAQLDEMERKRNIKIDPAYRPIYKTLGGVPHLDQHYTVFGEVVEGLVMIDSIAGVATDRFDRPQQDVRMHMELLSRKEVRRMEKLRARQQQPIPATQTGSGKPAR